MTHTSHVQRNASGFVTGPDVSLAEHPERNFVGEVQELLKEVDLLVQNDGLPNAVDEEIRRIVDVAIAVGFDYGETYGRTRPQSE
jgi:hypothetical protein